MVFTTPPTLLHGKTYCYKGFPHWVQNLEKGSHSKQLVFGVTAVLAFSWAVSQLALTTNNLPPTMTPEIEAKHIAWMKFNNVNPIFGVSRHNN